MRTELQQYLKYLEPEDDEKEFQIVTVHRYKEPDRFGMHRMAPRDPALNTRVPFSHLTLGLFSSEWHDEFVSLLEDSFVKTAFGDLTEQERYNIIHSCCPIEWHGSMGRGEGFEYVVVYKWKRA